MLLLRWVGWGWGEGIIRIGENADVKRWKKESQEFGVII